MVRLVTVWLAADTRLNPADVDTAATLATADPGSPVRALTVEVPDNLDVAAESEIRATVARLDAEANRPDHATPTLGELADRVAALEAAIARLTEGATP